MTNPPLLRIYLEPDMLHLTQSGKMNFLNILRKTIAQRGWQSELHPTGPVARAAAPSLEGYALYHMQAPTHDRALTFRRAYHYPFWRIEQVQQRWRFDVAQTRFDPETVDPGPARDFVRRLAARVLPGPPPQAGDTVLVPLQGHIRRQRSFQSHSPLQMLARVAETGRPVLATLHPKERYDATDCAALAELGVRHANLRIGGDTLAELRNCAFVVTENSAVAFDGYILGKPAVLFAQIDFHHIGLNVAQLGVDQALARASTHAPDYERYLWWFLQEQAINATLPNAPDRILASMRKGGWPI